MFQQEQKINSIAANIRSSEAAPDRTQELPTSEDLSQLERPAVDRDALAKSHANDVVNAAAAAALDNSVTNKDTLISGEAAVEQKSITEMSYEEMIERYRAKDEQIELPADFELKPGESRELTRDDLAKLGRVGQYLDAAAEKVSVTRLENGSLEFSITTREELRSVRLDSGVIRLDEKLSFTAQSAADGTLNIENISGLSISKSRFLPGIGPSKIAVSPDKLFTVEVDLGIKTVKETMGNIDPAIEQSRQLFAEFFAR